MSITSRARVRAELRGLSGARLPKAWASHLRDDLLLRQPGVNTIEGPCDGNIKRQQPPQPALLSLAPLHHLVQLVRASPLRRAQPVDAVGIRDDGWRAVAAWRAGE